MQQFYDMLKSNSLFKGFTNEELTYILDCLNANVKTYGKNQIIRQSETSVKEIGIVVEGSIFVTKIDYEGNRSILYEVPIGESFGESLAFADAEYSPITIVSANKSKVIFLSAGKIIEGCPSLCKFHAAITKNLIFLMAHKLVNSKIKNDILSQKTTREKLLRYFEYESKTSKSKTFRIHFSRAELADFLSLNTSAMSRELGKMRDEGMLTFHKDRFVLKVDDKD